MSQPGNKAFIGSPAPDFAPGILLMLILEFKQISLKDY